MKFKIESPQPQVITIDHDYKASHIIERKIEKIYGIENIIPSHKYSMTITIGKVFDKKEIIEQIEKILKKID